jgi:uncharacterized membrane protein (UPF0136 family)
MRWLTGVVAAYGLLNIVGGIMGFMKGSQISLIAGGTLGVLVLVAAYISTKNERPGFLMAAVLALAGAGNFISSFIKKGAIWPALIMAIASVIVLGCLGAGHFIAKRAQ